MGKRFFYADPNLNPIFDRTKSSLMTTGFLLNLVLFLFSLYLCSSRAFLLKNWKAILYSVLFTGIFSTGVCVAFVRYQLIHYDFNQDTGFEIAGIPLAAVLLCFTVPFASIAIYQSLNQRYPDNSLDRYTLAFSNMLLGLCVAFVFFAYTMAYSVVTFMLLFLFLLFIEFRNKMRFMYRFYRTYGLIALSYFLVSMALGTINGAAYHVAHTVKFNLAGVPFENYVLLFVMVLFTIYLFEAFKSRNHGTA
ncbi:lycopene cyclase domain-containing protein [Pedobacter sp.]|uniref:lycopene cyclase domain-containing protein n=1 Tax=Pedobacter sp. TaxID=1411316 RepID=UPI003D7F7153